MTTDDFRALVEAGPRLEHATIEAIQAAARSGSWSTVDRWWHDLNVFRWPDDLPGTQPAHVGTMAHAFDLIGRLVDG